MDLRVRAEVKPTEDPKRVAESVRNLFPTLALEETDGAISALGRSRGDLERLRDMLGEQGIRSTAQAFLSRRARDATLSFELNKQAAYAGRVNLVDFETPLGAILVEVRDKDGGIKELVGWLCGTE